jgi:hypothetical protein
MFVRLVLAGMVVVYEPTALVRHSHRVDEAALARQVRDYGAGLSAMITKHLLVDHRHRRLIVRRIPSGLHHLFGADSEKNVRRTETFPRSLARQELIGLLSGPWRYLKGRRLLRRSIGPPLPSRQAVTP